jgi:hypothetical protein
MRRTTVPYHGGATGTQILYVFDQRKDKKGHMYDETPKGKVVAIDAGRRSRRADGEKPGESVQPHGHGQPNEWFETVDTLASFVWSSARAGRVGWQVSEEVFRIAWLRFADHFTVVPNDAVEGWLQETVVRERIRMTALRPRFG